MKFSDYSKTKYVCYFTYLAMSSVFSLPPILFLTFHKMYGISYTLLGSLVLTNFFTQLMIDLIFTFFNKLFDIKKTIRVMPLLTSLGLFIYAFSPFVFKNNVYLGLIIGTFIFSVAAGLCEVLLSPIVAAIPSETTDKDLSVLHSLYAYGVVLVVVVSTIVLKIIGEHYWMYITMFWAFLPILSFVFFCVFPIPDIRLDEKNGENTKGIKGGLTFCVLCIFLGSATENVMTNWISGYFENVLRINKMYGDIFGMALFAVFIGLGRTIYSKYGKNISKVLFYSMIGSAICYIVAGVTKNIVLVGSACILTGAFTSMLWPGTLILMEEKLPNLGVFAYALMAAGGDCGASVAPQLLGILTDKVSVSHRALQWCERFNITSEQLGLRVGIITSALFPLLGIVLFLFMKKFFESQNK